MENEKDPTQEQIDAHLNELAHAAAKTIYTEGIQSRSYKVLGAIAPYVLIRACERQESIMIREEQIQQKQSDILQRLEATQTEMKRDGRRLLFATWVLVALTIILATLTVNDLLKVYSALQRNVVS
jgi:hypothetical protein